MMVNDFMAALRTAQHGRIGTRVQKVQAILGWSQEAFDEAVRYARDRRMIQLSTDYDPDFIKREEIDGAFIDENGFYMVSVRTL